MEIRGRDKKPMELDKLSNKQLDQEDPSPLSGAYIRSLVKQLKTSKPKESMDSTKDPGCVFDASVSPSRNLRKHGKVLGARQAHQQQQQQQHKKQVRRRLHTSRPYQERLLNMAEARREIVTALKFHRAAMKQASEEQKNQQQEPPSVLESLHPSHLSSFEQDGRFKCRRNPRIYPSCNTTNFSTHNIPPLSVPNSYTLTTWPTASSFSPTPLVAENPNLTTVLPNQTLGLNLNLHDFNNLDATLLLNNNNNNYNSSYSSPPLSVVTDMEVPSIGISSEGGEGVSSVSSAATTHTAMDDEGMAEMRSLGEQYQMEWNDTMNLVTSALWFNFLNNMEHDAHAPQVKTHHDDDATIYHRVFDELTEFPAAWWLNAKESCLEQCSEDYYFQAPNLPW